MRKKRQSYPYVRGASIFLSCTSLNLLAQVRGPGESWSSCLDRVVRGWALQHKIVLNQYPSLEEVIRVRQNAEQLPLDTAEEKISE